MSCFNNNNNINNGVDENSSKVVHIVRSSMRIEIFAQVTYSEKVKFYELLYHKNVLQILMSCRKILKPVVIKNNVI